MKLGNKALSSRENKKHEFFQNGVQSEREREEGASIGKKGERKGRSE